jgi:hypothetical protein
MATGCGDRGIRMTSNRPWLLRRSTAERKMIPQGKIDVPYGEEEMALLEAEVLLRAASKLTWRLTNGAEG